MAKCHTFWHFFDWIYYVTRQFGPVKKPPYVNNFSKFTCKAHCHKSPLFCFSFGFSYRFPFLFTLFQNWRPWKILTVQSLTTPPCTCSLHLELVLQALCEQDEATDIAHWVPKRSSIVKEALSDQNVLPSLKVTAKSCVAPLCTGEGSTSSIAARVATSSSSQSLKIIDNLVELRRVQCTQYIGMLLSIT